MNTRTFSWRRGGHPLGGLFGKISTEELLMHELVYWIKHSDEILTGTNLINHDVILCSPGPLAPSVLGIKKEFMHKETNKQYEYQNLTYEIYRPLRENLFNVEELNPAITKIYSYRHCNILRFILKTVRLRFKRFMFCVYSQYNEGLPIQGVDNLRETVVYLRNICERLTTLQNNHRGICIPDLHTYNLNSFRMSHSLGFMNDWVEDYPKKNIYTLGFSKATARVFSAELKKIILQGTKDHGFSLMNTDTLPGGIQNSRFSYDIPQDLRKRLDMVEQLLGLRDKGPVKSNVGKVHLVREQGKLIVLLEALHRIKAIKKDNEVYRQALALALLTDSSYHTYQSKIRKPNKFDYKAVFGKEKHEVILKELREFHQSLGKAIEEIVTKNQ